MKIRTLQEMLRLMYVRRDGTSKRWVLCHGVFDVLHCGHIAHLEYAKSCGDSLIVSVSPDHAVQKGPGRPHFKQEHRAKQVAALQAVDYVIACECVGAIGVLTELQPDVYVKGYDIKINPTEAFYVEKEYVESYGGLVLFSPGPPAVQVYHSTQILDAVPNPEKELG